ncbi:MucBP_domain-containing protein [Hexamita inflata]|uniref:MucBP domain-containing protein n=1 Tax=Hexamita inflata TaxID=28002 RepID=A0AA86UPG9_9EUKA|nr:MucBP domain-containing protein [Hexamita inflata]
MSLHSNQIIDHPLSYLTYLLSLQLFENPVIDISPLINLEDLEELYFDKNFISDFSALNTEQFTDYYFSQQTIETVVNTETCSYTENNFGFLFEHNI